MDTTIRLDKYLANIGVCSRRAVDNLLEKNTVTINGKRVVKSGERLDPSTDILYINGVKPKKAVLKYYLLNKPKGFISTTADERSRKDVVSLIKTTERIYPVGRLDKDTTGLLILTNDGELTNLLTHPRYHIAKTYRLTIIGTVSQEQLDRIRKGMLLDDGQTSPAEVKVINKNAKETILDMTIHEGRNRQIRRMCEKVGLKLKELERIAIGTLRDPQLKVGHYRELSRTEIHTLNTIG
ncbi:MAG TPA: pseudouridine synthase [Patescibacteria group bacterium]|nr:pseudouridine synthase [Patescibacteria group bacterium]